VRLFLRGKVESAIKCDPAHVEVYPHGRYLTITGRHIPGTPEEIRPAPRTMAAMRARVEAVRAARSGPPGRSQTAPAMDRAMAPALGMGTSSSAGSTGSPWSA